MVRNFATRFAANWGVPLIAIGLLLALVAYSTRTTATKDNHEPSDWRPVDADQELMRRPNPSNPLGPIRVSVPSKGTTDFRPASSRNRAGSRAWFEASILAPLREEVDRLDPKGATGAALEFLRACSTRQSSSFEDRMVQAAVLRLTPYAVRGNRDLDALASKFLSEMLTASATPTYTRMAALAALFGLELSYDVRPIPVAESEEYLKLEVYTSVLESQSSSRPDGMSLRSFASGSAVLRESCRRLLQTTKEAALMDSLCLSLSLSPTIEDQRVLSETILGNRDLDRSTKAHVVQAMVSTGDPETITLLQAGAARAQAQGDDVAAYLFREGLVNGGQEVVEFLEECRKDIQINASARAFSHAADLLCRMHVRAGSSESGALLEKTLVDPSTPASYRKLLLGKIVEHKNVRMLPCLRTMIERENDPSIRQILHKSVETLSSP